MKIAVAQLQSEKANIEKNICKHAGFIKMAAEQNANAVFFPELSLTGYEPAIAKAIAVSAGDERLTVFESLSNENRMSIGVGIPTICSAGVLISLVVFQPGMLRQVYSKQYLHNDELPYFIAGNEPLHITVQNKKIALAICYESLLPHHAERAGKEGIDLYIVSAAKSAKGVATAYRHYPAIAKAYAMPVMMANCTGHCDNFQSAGSSAVWNKEGELIDRLSEDQEGLLVFDTENDAAVTVLAR